MSVHCPVKILQSLPRRHFETQDTFFNACLFLAAANITNKTDIYIKLSLRGGRLHHHVFRDDDDDNHYSSKSHNMEPHHSIHSIQMRPNGNRCNMVAMDTIIMGLHLASLIRP